MGAWGFRPFENDDACDWLYELEKSSDISVISAAFHHIINNASDYLEAPDCANAIAAAEITAALRGHPLMSLPDNAREWVEAHHLLDASNLVPSALAAIQRIRTDSELKELWDESDEAPEWYKTLDDLNNRLIA